MKLHATTVGIAAVAAIALVSETCTSQVADIVLSPPSAVQGSSSPQAIQSTAEVSYLLQEQGARVVASTSRTNGSWQQIGNGGRVTTGTNSPFPHHAVWDLGEERTIGQVVFNNRPHNSAGSYNDDRTRLARDVELQISNTSATEGFQRIGAWRLERSDGQRVRIATPATGRWLRLVITANHGHESQTIMGSMQVTSGR